MPKVLVRQPFVYDSDAVSADSGLVCPEVSKADQSGKDEADINTLVRRFGITGHMPVITALPLSSDFVGLTSYQECANALLDAQKAFESLPAEMRHKFHHDPGEFVEFCSNPDNKDEMDKLGLLKALEPPPAPVRVEVVSKAEPAA